jgi:hypothetical protein
MARTFSPTMTQAQAAQETGEGEVVLLTLEHASWSTVRLTNHTTAITSNGNTFQSFPFQATLPEESDREKSAKLTVDNADRRLVSELRTIQTPAQATLQVVLLSDPDTIELEVGPLRVEKANIGLTQIELPLGAEPVAYQSFPKGRFTPEQFQALF